MSKGTGQDTPVKMRIDQRRRNVPPQALGEHVADSAPSDGRLGPSDPGVPRWRVMHLFDGVRRTVHDS
jgi:hypothetical protein